jgi:hypothetical protein
VGTDPDDWLDGYSAYRFAREEAARLGGDVTIEFDDVSGFEEGTVGWGVARPTVTLPDGRRVTSRCSAVFHLNGGEWKIVQLHSSFGHPRDDDPGRAGREVTGSTLAGTSAA